jgi:hypothetical protein
MAQFFRRLRRGLEVGLVPVDFEGLGFVRLGGCGQEAVEDDLAERGGHSFGIRVEEGEDLSGAVADASP